jgi:hypothetical protein
MGKTNCGVSHCPVGEALCSLEVFVFSPLAFFATLEVDD